MTLYKCPKCGSAKINQYRMPFGAMWCLECGFRIEDKNKKPNPFLEKEESGAPPATPPDSMEKRRPE
jgi:DNA-directed RNA polymerase subunit RPC12/RpoP